MVLKRTVRHFIPIQVHCETQLDIKLERICKRFKLNLIENEQDFSFDCLQHRTFQTTLHNMIQGANTDNAYFTENMIFLFFFVY